MSYENWAAIIVAAVAAFLEGAIWFSPFVFGRIWAKGLGKDVAPKGRQLGLSYVVMFLTNILTALVVATLLGYFEVDYRGGVQVFWFSVMIWIGVMFPLKFGDVLWKNEKSSVFFVELFYQLISFMTITAIICTMWR